MGRVPPHTHTHTQVNICIYIYVHIFVELVLRVYTHVIFFFPFNLRHPFFSCTPMMAISLSFLPRTVVICFLKPGGMGEEAGEVEVIHGQEIPVAVIYFFRKGEVGGYFRGCEKWTFPPHDYFFLSRKRKLVDRTSLIVTTLDDSR